MIHNTELAVQSLWPIAGIWLLAYAVGSLNTALLGARLGWWPDPRQAGSGNAGMTNMWRLHGWRKALVVLAGDIGKAWCVLAYWESLGAVRSDSSEWAWLWCGLILGHCFPLFFRGRGGKGVATAWGGLAGLSFITACGAAGLFAALLAVTRYVSWASVATVTVVTMGYIAAYPHAVWPLVILWACIVWQHRSNMRRWLQGKEPQLSWK